MHGSSSTQTTVRLSSGEAEYAALVKGAAEAIFIRNLLRFMWEEEEIELESDSTAAIGAVKRIGPGKRLRHVEVELFFLQQLVRQGVIAIVKRDGKNHPPDICTKHLAWPDIKRLLAYSTVAHAGYILIGLACFSEMGVASAIYYAEAVGENAEDFASIPRIFWFIMVTMTTVGYGDVSPITPIGKFLASLVALSGIGLVAMPTGIMASAFSEAMQRRREAAARAVDATKATDIDS